MIAIIADYKTKHGKKWIIFTKHAKERLRQLGDIGERQARDMLGGSILEPMPSGKDNRGAEHYLSGTTIFTVIEKDRKTILVITIYNKLLSKHAVL